MADIELCTDSPQGPYLVAPDWMAADLEARLGAAGMPCVAAPAAIQRADGQSAAVIAFRDRVVLGPLSAFLNDNEYDWELCGM
jgi:hypothetical protein